MAKTLFISSLVSGNKTGGAMVAKRNFEVIKKIMGEEDVILYTLESFAIKKKSIIVDSCKRILRLCRGYMNGSTQKINQDIINVINQNNVNIVFIDSSLNGLLVKQIKKRTGAKVISFFHNCEYSLLKQGILKGEFESIFRILPARFNEKLTVNFSDNTIVLNERDGLLLSRLYHKNDHFIIPITLDDKFLPYEKREVRKVKNILFVGSNFFPNINGVNWFIKNVLPYIDCKLTFVGRDIDKANIIKSSKLEIVANPDNLTSFYEDADLVVVPIFEGGGMKVKVAEALMYGKVVLASKEATQGYENIDTVIECNSASDFINNINKFQGQSNSEISREAYINRYSTKSAIEKFKELFSL